jgi:hypothetical protein
MKTGKFQKRRTAMQLVVRRIGASSLAKVLGTLYGAVGLVGGAIFSVAVLLGLMRHSGSPPSDLISMLFGAGAVIVFPILYGLVGFLSGLLIAWHYNILAELHGGVVFETRTEPSSGD